MAAIWPWLLGALALAALVFFGLRYFAAPSIPNHVTLSLPGGTSIDVAEGSIGYQVAKYLNSADPAPKTFVFDNLNYATASATLTPESAPTVATIVAIMKAYPNVRCRVVGFTDNQGDSASNQKLSEARANTVKQEMINGGIAADRIDSSGMGEANPIADNNTEDGRARNRRTEFTVISK